MKPIVTLLMILSMLFQPTACAGRTAPAFADVSPSADDAQAAGALYEAFHEPEGKALDEEANRMYIQVGDIVWTAALEDSPSVTAWKELLARGPLTVDMSDYGGFEKVGGIGTTLTQNDRQITTEPGDIILYQGSSVTIYYGKNSWNFTLLGHIDGVTETELREVLKAGGEDVRVTFSLEEPT